MRELVAVLPMYNEVESAGVVVRTWAETFDSLGIDWEIRVYDDGSSDGSADAVRTEAVQFGDRVRVITKPNQGHGPTVLAGYREAVADAEWIFQTDSDGELLPDGFAGLWARRGEFDFLVGRRTGRDQGLARRIVSSVSRITVRVLFGRSVTDVNSPYRLMRSAAFAPILGKIPADTFAPNVVLTGLAATKGIRSREADVEFRPRTAGVCSIRRIKLLKAAARSFVETLEIGFGTRRGLLLLGALALLSVVAKVAATFFGYNYDYESYEIVADIVRAGGDVYASTPRYNYSPVWSNVIFLLDAFSKSHLRIAIAVFLGLVDVGIASFLWLFVSRVAAGLFLALPLSLYISGFHGQFDNLAVLAALVASAVLLRAESDGPESDDRRTLIGAGLLGLSLCIKHIFIFFPIWFLFRPIALRRRLIVLVLPAAIFLMSFAPHVPIRAYPVLCADIRMLVGEWRSTGSALTERTNAELTRQEAYWPGLRAPIGIVRNVFLYRSYPFAPLLRIFQSPEKAKEVPGLPFMVLALTVIGFMCRKKDPIASALVYSAAVVVFSPSMADQYLAIPLAFTCATCSIAGISYSLFTGGLLLPYLVTKEHFPDELLYEGAVAILVVLLLVYSRRLTARAAAIDWSMS